MSDFDLSEGDIWRVNIIETADHGTAEQVCGYFGKVIASMVFPVSSFMMLPKLDIYSETCHLYPGRCLCRLPPNLSKIRNRLNNLIYTNSVGSHGEKECLVNGKCYHLRIFTCSENLCNAC